MALDPASVVSGIAQGTAAQMTPAQMTNASMAAVNANAAQMGNTPDMTAAQMGGTTTTQQLEGILNKGGPLMQQAANAGNAAAASRGLLNSSMGIQAAQSAILQNAAQLANSNAQQINQTEQFNTGNQQQTNQINTQNAFTKEQVNTGNQQQVGLANQQAANSANQQNAAWQQQGNQFNAGNQQSANQFNTQQTNAMNQWNAGQKNEAIKQTLDLNSREALANVEANYKTLLQANSSASGMYEQYLKNISEISTNKDMDANAKSAAITNQVTYLNAGMKMLEGLNSMQGLTFAGVV